MNLDCVFVQETFVALIELPKRLVGPLPVDTKVRAQFQPVGKWIVPSRPDLAILGARGDAQIIKGKIVLLVQADRGLGAVFFLVKKPEELLVIRPVPAGVADV